MAINKKLIHFKTKAVFDQKLANNELLDTSIVFIKDVKQIWTHGQLYDCALDYNTIVNRLTELENNDAAQDALIAALQSKQDAITGAATTIVSNNLTKDRALISNGSGKVAVSGVTSTELGRLSGVTSSVQTQLNNINNTVATNTATLTAISSNNEVKPAKTDFTGGIRVSNVTTDSKTVTSGSTASRFYGLQIDKDNKGFVNVPWTDTKVTSVGNHYTPSTDANQELSVDASASSSASWGSTSLVTGVNLQRDAKGHVTGVTVDSIKMPSNPDTNTTYSFVGGTNGFTVTPSNGSAQTVTVTPSVSKSDVGLGNVQNYNLFSGTGAFKSAIAYPIVNAGVTELGHRLDLHNVENSSNDYEISLRFASSGSNTKRVIYWPNSAGTLALTSDIPTIPTIPSLSGGSAAANDATVVGGVTVNGHAVSVGKKTITGAGTVSVTGSTTGITITGSAHPTSLKNPHSLTFGSKSYDGSSGQEITAADLGLGAALKYKGITTTNVVDDRTTANVTIDSKTHTPSTGDVVFYGNKEFVWNGSKWEELGYANTLTLNQVTTGGPSGTSSVASSGHTHSVTASGSVSSSFTGSAVNTGTPSSNTTSVATGAHTHGTSSNGDHTHTVTATGSVSSSFTGTAVNTGTDSSNVASVSLDSHKHTISATGTTSKVSVPTTSHTHTVSISGSGSFTGTAGNTGGPSANTTSVASGTHTHSVTGTVQSGGASHTHTYDTYSLSASASGGVLTISLSTGSGNVGYTTASHSHVFASGSASATAASSRYDVPNTSHTHSFTPSGSVSFSGSDATTGSASSASGHTVSVATGAHVHSMGTAIANDSTSSVSVSTSSHKHSVTASGSVSSSFTGTSATTSETGSHSHTANASTNNTTNRVSVPNTSHTHSVTAAGSVSSSFTGTAVTSGTPSGTTSVGSSSHTHTVTPTGSIS